MSPVTPGDVSRLAREVVAKRTLVLAGVAAIAHLLVLTGAVPTGISEQAEAWTVSIIDAVGAVGVVFWVRSGTTPADPALAPTSTNGKPLVEAPATDAGGHVHEVSAERADLRRRLGDDDPFRGPPAGGDRFA